MTKYERLRKAATKATCGSWSLDYGDDFFYDGDALICREIVGYLPICRVEGAHPKSGFEEEFIKEQQSNAEFIAAANPATVLELLDELERNQQYIKRCNQWNEGTVLTAGKLLIENGRLVADTLRHLADNEIDSDYFAITSTNENGTEIDHEMAITDYALQAAGTVDELVAALEAAEKRIAELAERNAEYVTEISRLEKERSALAVENAGLKSEAPLGAIENGRAFAYRLENYQLECEGGNLNMCSDWQEFRRCFEYLSEWAIARQSTQPPTQIQKVLS